MSHQPKWKRDQQPPFTVIGIDRFGPLLVKGIGGHARKTFKAWGLIVYCLNTGAVDIWACSGYDTKVLLTALGQHTSIYGTPDNIVSDHGTQMVAATKDSINCRAVMPSV